MLDTDSSEELIWKRRLSVVRITGDGKGLAGLPKDLGGVGSDSAGLAPVLLERRILGAVARFTSPARDDQHREINGALGLFEWGIGEVLEHFQGTVHAAR